MRSPRTISQTPLWTPGQRSHVRLVALLCVALGLTLEARADEGAAPNEQHLSDATVLGEVFCDDDENGSRAPQEEGIGGVRIVADHGWQAKSDTEGRFHLGRFQPGQHLLKLDETSLPPWATLKGSARRRMLMTGGLVTQVSFPLTCNFEVVRAQGIDLGAKTPKEPGAPLTTVSGGLAPLSLYFDGHPIEPISADMRLRRQGQKATRGLNTPWHPGVLDPPLELLTRTRLGKDAKGTWRLEVNRMVEDGQVPVRVFHGQGAPPKSISWDGTNELGSRSVLERGALYTLSLRVTDGQGQAAIAPPTVLGISYGTESAAIERRILRGAVLGDPTTSTEEITRGLDGFSNILWANKGARILVEVHTDDSLPTEVAVTRSRRDAFVLAKRVAQVLGLSPERIFGMGYGPTRPIRPNINESNRALNRRVEVAVLPREKPGDLGTVPLPPAKPTLSIQGLPLELDSELTFMRSLEEREGQMALSAQLPNGGRWQALVSLEALSGASQQPPASQDPLRRFGGRALREALGDAMIASRVATHDTAEELEVQLPAEGATVQSPHLFVRGKTHPDNSITIGGLAVPTDSRGYFAVTVALAAGENRLEIVSTDKSERSARIFRTLHVSDEAYFVLALAEGATGMLEAHLPGRSKENAAAIGPVFIQGRGAAVFRGRISGTELAEHLNITAQIDTNKHTTFRSFVDQVIDPLRDYAVYGDSAGVEQIGPARGPLYVLIEADASHALAGNFRTEITGMELLRYDRAVYGGVVHFERAWSEGWTSKARVFGTEDVGRLKRGHDELRATGGSLYYLSSSPVLEGSERVSVVIREQGSGLVLERRRLRRDHDYRVDYLDGRIHLKAPLSAVSASTWGLSSFQVATERAVLQGHEVWLVADYETEDPGATGEYAVGTKLSQELYGMAEVGASFVQEGRRGEDYTLFGADTRVEVWEGTEIRAEFAGSIGTDGESRLSRDGGLSFASPDPALGLTSGFAFKLGVETEPAKWFDAEVDLNLRGWWELVEPGFHSLGHTLDQGKERFGGEAVYRPSEDDEIRLRIDGTRWQAPNALFPSGFGLLHRYLYAARYSRALGPVELSAEAAFGEHRDDARGEVFHTGGFLLGAHWQVNERFGLRLGQEALVGGDDEVLGRSTETRMTTRMGMDFLVMEDLALMLGTAIRWDGDHAIQMGARTRADDGTDVYVHEELRPAHGGHSARSATVIGTERQIEGGGRVYSEYRLGGVANGMANRAVLGIAKRFELGPGVNLSTGYERSHSVGGQEGIGSRDVLSVGLEVLAFENLRYGGRYEVRIDQLVEPPTGIFSEVNEGRSEIIQAVLSNGLTWRISPELTAIGTARFVFNQDLVSRAVLRESLEGSIALLYKPQTLDWLTLSGRYGRVHRRWFISEEDRQAEEEVDVAGVAALFTLPWGITLTERLLFRHRDAVSSAEDLDELLWITHGAVKVAWDIDIAAEYRLWATFDGEVGHGALAEVGYTLLDYARIGVGYDFSSIPRDLSLDVDSGAGGVYVRLTGTY